jgi:hypothetical protein
MFHVSFSPSLIMVLMVLYEYYCVLSFINMDANRILGITLWPLVHKRTIPTDRPPLVDEI